MKKIIIPTDVLRPALKKLSLAVHKATVLPVLSNLLLRARSGEVELTTTDLELTIHYACSCECKDEFEMLIPFEFLQKIVSLSGSIPLEIQLLSVRKGQIIGEDDIYQLNSLEKIADFPKLPEIPKKNVLKLDGAFMEWLDKAMGCCGKDDSRPALMKACLDFTGEGIAIVSTDAQFLFRYFVPMQTPGKEQLLISPKIGKAMAGFAETSLFWHAKHVAFKAGNVTLIATRHEDKYPDYKVVIPDHPANLPLNRHDLISALDRVALASDKQVTVSLQGNPAGKIRLFGTDPDLERKIEVSLSGKYEGKAGDVVLNPSKLLTLMDQIEFDEVDFHIDTPTRAVLISSAEDANYLGMIMPISL